MSQRRHDSRPRISLRPCSCYPHRHACRRARDPGDHRIGECSEQALAAWSLEAFQPRIGLCTSFAVEDLGLTDALTSLTDRVRIFTLETGRLMPVTYAPRTEPVEVMTREDGVNRVYRAVEARQRCCVVLTVPGGTGS